MADDAVTEARKGDSEGWPPSVPERPIAFLLLDGLRRPGRGSDVLLCALGLTLDGERVPLAARPAAREDEHNWRELLRGLRERGIGGELVLIASDGHPALVKAAQATFPDVPQQLSVPHRLLALARRISPRWRRACMNEARQIFTAPDRGTAVARFREWHGRWLRLGEPAVRTMEPDLAACLAFYRFPPHLWPRIRTVSAVEQAFRHVRREQEITRPPEPAVPEATELDRSDLPPAEPVAVDPEAVGAAAPWPRGPVPEMLPDVEPGERTEPPAPVVGLSDTAPVLDPQPLSPTDAAPAQEVWALQEVDREPVWPVGPQGSIPSGRVEPGPAAADGPPQEVQPRPALREGLTSWRWVALVVLVVVLGLAAGVVLALRS
ncbi:MAG: transposase [Armatimonadota bacterium]|nr:transposase [Armatimonadota bacterium]